MYYLTSGQLWEARVKTPIKYDEKEIKTRFGYTADELMVEDAFGLAWGLKFRTTSVSLR